MLVLVMLTLGRSTVSLTEAAHGGVALACWGVTQVAVPAGAVTLALFTTVLGRPEAASWAVMT